MFLICMQKKKDKSSQDNIEISNSEFSLSLGTQELHAFYEYYRTIRKHNNVLIKYLV